MSPVNHIPSKDTRPPQTCETRSIVGLQHTAQLSVFTTNFALNESVSLSNFSQHNANPKLAELAASHPLHCTTTTRKMLRVSVHILCCDYLKITTSMPICPCCSMDLRSTRSNKSGNRTCVGSSSSSDVSGPPGPQSWLLFPIISLAMAAVERARSVISPAQQLYWMTHAGAIEACRSCSVSPLWLVVNISQAPIRIVCSACVGFPEHIIGDPMRTVPEWTTSTFFCRSSFTQPFREHAG